MTILTPTTKPAGEILRSHDLGDGTALFMVASKRGFEITLMDTDADMPVDTRSYPTRERADVVFDGAVELAATH